MQIRTITRSISVIAMLLLTTTLHAGPHGLDNANWLAEIEQQFAGVQGYSAVIVNANGFVHQKSGGVAAPGKSMTWDTYGNIGSVKKMLASLLMMRLIEDKVGRGNLNLIRNEIDQPAYKFLPAKIRQQVPAINRQIQIRHLLQHRSGFRTEHNSGNPMHDLLTPVNQSDFLQREYSNTNFKLLTYVIVGYVAPHIIDQTDDMIWDQNLSSTDDKIIQKLGYYYYGIMLNRLLNEAPLQAFGSCWPKEHIIQWPGRDIALMYENKGDASTSGGVYQQGPTVGHCKAMGGWYFSMRNLARLFRDLGTNSGVISPTAYNWMFDEAGNSATWLHRLGWGGYIGSPFLQALFGWNAFPYHGGSHTIIHFGKPVTSRAAVIRLPGGYHSMAIVNSNEMDSRTIAKALKNAFARSLIAV